MKRITTLLIFVLSYTLLMAQGPQTNAVPFEQVKKKLDKSIANSEHPKKGLKAKTWIKLGETYVLAANVNTQTINRGMAEMVLKSLMGKSVSKAEVEENGKKYKMSEYARVKLYINEEGQLYFWKDKETVVENGLDKAFEAYKKAKELDVKGKATKTIIKNLEDLAKNYQEIGTNYFNQADYKTSAVYFAKKVEVNAMPEINIVDTTMIYYAAYSYKKAGQTEEAIKYYERLIELDYVDEGAVYAEVSELYKTLGNDEKSLELLEAGFLAYPKNMSIMGSLINIYLTSGKDPVKILDLLASAKKQTPDNASLYYVEGNLYTQLTKFEEAIASYNQAIEKDPKYLLAYYGIGDIFLKNAAAFIKEANDLPPSDFKGYDALIEKANVEYKKAIPHLEKALEIDPNDKDILVILKQIYFRYRSESDELMKKYEDVKSRLEE